MFPITAAWNGYEIDDAVLEEYNAATYEFLDRFKDAARSVRSYAKNKATEYGKDAAEDAAKRAAPYLKRAEDAKNQAIRKGKEKINQYGDKAADYIYSKVPGSRRYSKLN